jgi:hypothetical protein
MPANQSPSAESDAQAAAWQRELNRDRLMGRRYVEAERLAGPGAAPMPGAGRNVMEPPGGFAKGGEGLQRQLAKSAARGAKMLPGQGGSQSNGGSASEAAQAVEQVGAQAGKNGIFRAAITSMWADYTLASLLIANIYALMAMNKNRLTVPLNPLEKIAVISADVIFLFIAFVLVVFIAAIACPLSGSCPLSGADMLGMVRGLF